MRLLPRVFCIIILGISIVFNSNEAPIHRNEEFELSTEQDLSSKTKIRSETNYLTASYIPPFLRNLYSKISQKADLRKAKTLVNTFKGHFEETDVPKQHFLSFPSLYSDEFFNFTFGLVEIRIWYQCANTATINSPLYLELTIPGLEFRKKIQVSCGLIDSKNRPTSYNWAIFDVTDFLQSLQATHSNHLRPELRFSIQTHTPLIRIKKQFFATKFNPVHMPLLTFYSRNMIKRIDPKDVSMRFVATNDAQSEDTNGFKRSTREVVQRNRYSPCSRVSKIIKVKTILELLRNRKFNYVYPTRVNFGYCQGYCPYRLINHHNGTAHSQIMNAFARKNHEPRYATCIPASYGNLYVLQSYNIGNTPVTSIEKYRDAVVRNCGCR